MFSILKCWVIFIVIVIATCAVVVAVTVNGHPIIAHVII